MVGDMQEEQYSTPIPRVKDLASSDPKLRRQNLNIVLEHLKTCSAIPKPLTSTQALQLWRGFYVQLHMHDSRSPISVQNLISTLASTFNTIAYKDQIVFCAQPTQSTNGQPNGKNQEEEDEEEEWGGIDDDDDDDDKTSNQTDMSASPSQTPWLSTYSTAFWTTMAREWPNLDQHRINKYLLLIRMVVREIFTICLVNHLISSSITSPTTFAKLQLQNQMHILSEWPLSPRDRKISDGLRLHILDIWNDEVIKSLETARTRVEKMVNPTSEDEQNSHEQQEEGDGDNDDEVKKETHKSRKRTRSNNNKSTTEPESKKKKKNRENMNDPHDGLTSKPHYNPEPEIKRPEITTAQLQTFLRTTFTPPIQNIASNGLAKHVRNKAKDVLGEFDEVVNDLKWEETS